MIFCDALIFIHTIIISIWISLLFQLPHVLEHLDSKGKLLTRGYILIILASRFDSQ